MRNALLVAVLAGIGLLALTRDAYAYLDPGTASIILQGLIGGIAAVAAVAAAHWQRIKNTLSRILRRGGTDGLAAANSDDE